MCATNTAQVFSGSLQSPERNLKVVQCFSPAEGQCLRCDMFSLPPPPPPVLKSVPFTARTAKRGSRFFCEANLCDDANC